MRRALFGLAPLALLAACGDGVPFSGEARAAYDTCVSGGGEAAYCTCVTNTLQEKMSPEAFSKMAKGEQAADLEATLIAIGQADESCKGK